jgi:hypothetical protein
MTIHTPNHNLLHLDLQRAAAQKATRLQKTKLSLAFSAACLSLLFAVLQLPRSGAPSFARMDSSVTLHRPPPISATTPVERSFTPKETETPKQTANTNNQQLGSVLGVTNDTTNLGSTDIRALITQSLQTMLAQGLLTGPQGPKGDPGLAPGFSGPNGVVQNDNGKTTAVVGGNAIVTYVPPVPSNGFGGTSLAGFGGLSASSFTAGTANITGNLITAGNSSFSSATFSGLLTAATSTLSSLTVSGPATFTGSTTIASLTVTGLNPGLLQGSIAFQGASGLTQDNMNLFYDATNHRLGLGTTTPAQALTVIGNAAISGAVSTQFLTVTGNATTTGNQIISGTLNVSGVSTLATTTATQLTTTGNVGIGTAAPGFNLDIQTTALQGVSLMAFSTSASTYGLMRIGRSNNNTKGTLTTTVDGQMLGELQFAGVNTGPFGDDGASIQAVQNGAPNGSRMPADLLFLTGNTTVNPTERMRITKDGNVGIGTTTPGALLHVYSSTANSQLLVDSAFSTGASYTNYRSTDAVDFYVGKERGSAGALLSGDIANSGILTTVGSQAIQFGTSNAVRMTIAAGGSIGIGTATPATLLDVNGAATIRGTLSLPGGFAGNVGIGTTTPIALLHVFSSGASTAIRNETTFATGYSFGSYINPDGALYIGKERSAGGGLLGGDIANAGILTTTNNQPIQIGTNNVVRMTIDSSGNVGVGTATPSSRLVIQGSGATSATAAQTTYNSAGTLLTTVLNNGNVGIGTAAPDAPLTIANGGALLNSGSGLNYYRNVGTYAPGTSPTGTMKITLPKAIGSGSFLNITIRGFNYIAGGNYGEWQVKIAGYDYSSGWHAYGSEISGNPPFSSIRLADDGTSKVILLGTTATSWVTPAVSITDVMVSGSPLTGWGSGWGISVISSETGINNIIATTPIRNGQLNFASVSTSTPISTDTSYNSFYQVSGSQYTRLGVVDGGGGISTRYTYVQGGFTGSGVYYNTVLNPLGGNVGIGTTTPTLGPLTMASGAYVTSGGVWTNASDRNLKENFATLTPASVLEKIGQLPITEWNYRNEDPSIKHIGPVAQDFYALFNVGNSNTSISTIDPAGIALLGIQALDQKLIALQGSLPGNVTSTGQLTVYSPSNFSGDSVGQAQILPGVSSVRVTFSHPYQYQPIITFSPASPAAGQAVAAGAYITNVDATGFTIQIAPQTPESVTSGFVTFNWHSFASPSAQLTVSDGTTQPIHLIVTTSPTGSTSAPASAALPPATDPVEPAPPAATSTPASASPPPATSGAVLATSTPASAQEHSSSTPAQPSAFAPSAEPTDAASPAASSPAPL